MNFISVVIQMYNCFLCVLCFSCLVEANLIITDFDQYQRISENLCIPPSTQNTNYYNYFIDSNPNITFDPAKGWTTNVRAKCDPTVDTSRCGTYNLEGVRGFESPLSLCTYCPYHLDPYWNSDGNKYVDQSLQYSPMYGPCLNKAPSLKMTCLQHHAFYPQKVFGKYFFPEQRPVEESLWQEVYNVDRVWDLPKHTFLISGGSSTPYNSQNQQKDPSEYGLGKKAVEAHLESIKFRYVSNQSVNEPLTQAFKHPYTTNNGVEQWMKWGQYFCYPGCHRNNRYTQINLRNMNILGDPELSYLSVFLGNTSSSIQPACRACPKYYASYNWLVDPPSPAHPKINPWADQCYPWFGAIPTMLLLGDTYVLNTTFRFWGQASDTVFFPDSDAEVHSFTCPVNTYNRVCAHTKAFIYNAAHDTPNLLTKEMLMNQYHCTPCPQGGYHTAGKEGQWYCQPPPGKLFRNPARELLQSNPDIWGDREKMSIYPELECGPEKEHCRQCGVYNLKDATPEQFNELFVFSLLLAEEFCPESSYCPDAFTLRSCPAERPWSPAGSWHISNCTCSKGSYFNGSSCLPCTSSCSTPGFYLPKTQCLDKNGATQDASCLRCDNIPAQWAIADDVGIELKAGFGSCSYHCDTGSEMVVVNGSLGFCERSRTCLPPRTRTDSNGRYVYREDLDVDRLTIARVSSTSFACAPRLFFSQQLSKLEEWFLQPLSCVGLCNNSRVCYAQNKSSPVDPSIPWYSFSSSLTCSLCPDLQELPPQAFLKIDINNDLRSGIKYCQKPNIFCSGIGDKAYYFNETAWLCQSCDERERAICPSMTRLRGRGCLGVNTPFNATSPSADCQPCTIKVPDINTTRGKQYLNYRNASAEGGCSIDPCPSLPNDAKHYYWKQPCGADFVGEYTLCTIDCPPNHFRKAECSAYSDLVCQNCTERRAGYQKISNCSLSEDSSWQLCSPGYYCDVSGKVTQCPADRTSLPGARDISDCFCKIGLQEDAVSNLCIPMQCSGTTSMPNIPGRSLNSTYYMTLDLETLSSTRCVQCNSNISSNIIAYTRGDALEITSCVCPRGYYGLYNAAGTQIQCTACPSSVSCGSNLKMPASCLHGDLKLAAGQPFPCVCAFTPFTSTSSSCSSTCLPGFNPTSTSTIRTISAGSYPQVTGSSMYSVKRGVNGQINPITSWNRFIASSGYQSFDNTVKSIAVTGCMDDSVLGNEEGQNLQVYHYEYVFWLVADPGIPVIFSALLQENLVDMAPQNIFTLPRWEVFTTSDFSLSPPVIIGIAASKWNIIEPYFSNGNNRDPWVYVAALIRETEGQGLFYMKARAFNTTNNQNTGFWGEEEYNITLPFPNHIHHATPVSIAHSTKRLGEKQIGGEGGFFFIAFNIWSADQPGIATCGGLIMVSPIGVATSVFMNSFCAKLPSASSGGGGITSMAVTLNPESSMPMVLLALSTGNALKIETSAPGDITLFFPSASNSPLVNLMVLFSLNNPVYISGMLSDTECENGMSYCLKAADSVQLSWTNIQGLPWGTSPAPQPMLMGSSVMSRGKALLIVSRGSALFTLPIYRCLSPTQYWDGAACVEHACIRQATCGPTMEASEGMCVCKNGYFLNPLPTSCSLCTQTFYCDRGIRLSCPYGTTTTKTGASSVNECICPLAGTFFNSILTTPRCTECRSVDSWCPNRWLSFSCPGAFATSVQLSSSLIAFPTKCSCAPGYSGVNCELCPEGYYCPASTAAQAMNTAAYYTFAQTPLSSLVMEHISSFFLSYFTQPGTRISNFNSLQDLSKILYMQKVQSTNSTRFGIMVMVQIDISFQGTTVDNFKGWHRDLLQYLKTFGSNVSDVTPGVGNNVDFSIVAINKPLQCMTSKVPSSPPSSCICAPGYETQKEQCSACPANTFKAFPGPGSCTACAIGTIAPIKASACIPDPSLLNPKQDSTSGGTDIAILVGGIGGGVVGLICLLFLVQSVIGRGRND